MISKTKKLLNAFNSSQSEGIPFWFMRQAGRYLPEYRQIRSGIPNFLEMCYNPQAASQVTLQPIERFGMDGAIIFSDILVIPDALGIHVRFKEKKGPILEPTNSMEVLNKLQWNDQKLLPVYEALRLTRATLPLETTLLGFAGSPWTLACYIVQGVSDQNFGSVREKANDDPIFFARLIELLVQSIIRHCRLQIDAGAEVIQLFDSWSGVLNEDEFTRWVIEPTKHIITELKQTHPHVPIIGFPRGAGEKYETFVKKTGVDGVNIDASVTLEFAKNRLQPLCIVQGNLDNTLLAENKEAMLAQAKEIISMLANGRFIFNLGHGIVPHTPVENVQALCDYLKSV
jgi:uroporphyrinogen decarboxylase